MRNAGTLKVEVIKPLNRTWDEAGERMRAMARALTQALNLTMREHYSEAVAQIEAKRTGGEVDQAWQTKARATLRTFWSSELARRLDYEVTEFRKGKRQREPDAAAYLPSHDALASETFALLMGARFKGDHFRDLLRNAASFPSWAGEQAFYSEGRKCEVAGTADQARLTFPLWGSGPAKSVQFAVAPAGGHARALWRRVVRDFARRQEIVDLERLAADRGADAADRERATRALEETGAVKLGRVGLKYDRRRRKWFALISWTEYRAGASAVRGQTAAVNYGVNVFAQALAEDGTTWDDAGTDLRVTRERFAARRRSIQRVIRRLGRGSRGHGKARRYLPVTKLEQRERRWTETRIRQHAADLVAWCVTRGVTRLVVHDLAEQRERFELETGGEAHEQMKRFVHSWPFYETRLAVERQAAEVGVEVVTMLPGGESCGCPECGHSEADNVRLVDGGGEYLVHGGRTYRSVEKWTRFECRVCGTRAKGDLVTCANMLRAVDARNPLGKMQEQARKRAKRSIKTVAARKVA